MASGKTTHAITRSHCLHGFIATDVERAANVARLATR